MDKNAWWKWAVLAAAVIFSVILVSPPKEKIRKGLDIQGGYSFILQLDEDALRATLKERNPDIEEVDLENKVKDAIKNADEVAVEVIRNRIDPLGVEEPVITRGGDDHRIYVQLPGATEEKRAMAERSVRSVAFLEFRLVHPNNQSLSAALLRDGKAPDGYRVVTVDGNSYYRRAENFAEVTGDPAAYARRLSRFEIPDPAYSFMLEQSDVRGETLYRPIFVRRRTAMTGEHLKKAKVSLDEYSRSVVNIEFDTDGARTFGKVTRDNVGKELAIILDGTVYSAPVINEEIPNGTAVISGRFSMAEANFLSTVLNAGALPAPLKFMGQRFVAPTLGEDAINGAIKAIVFGMATIILFMVAYYKMCGVVADIAFMLDLVLLPIGAVIVSGLFGVLISDTTSSGGSILKLPVLTLPGIAGILLTLGMAVDANVLIFERVREELAAGKRLFPSLMAGYERAFMAIFDSNLTTVITAIILFIFGSGLIRGFAVMLTAGIIVSMFTALVITKLIFQAVVKENNTGTVKMLTLVPTTLNVNFMKYAKQAIITAVTIIVVTISLGIAKGLKNPANVFAVDFTGGAKVTYTVADKSKAPVDKIREVANKIGISDATPQYQTTDSESFETGTTFLEVKTVKADVNGKDVAEVLTKALNDTMPEAGILYHDLDSVGSQIGNEMKTKALTAVILSLIGMIVYITLRFEFGFALGAIAALAHDVLITVGIYLLLGFQINLTIVAAVLTIVGYSVNDTIVIFDRIREELKLDKKSDFKTICNNCVNVTLSRTVLTSVTTAFTVIALLIFGKGDIFEFAVTMMIGIITGVFSTIYIATPVMLAWHRGKRPDFQKKN